MSSVDCFGDGLEVEDLLVDTAMGVWGLGVVYLIEVVPASEMAVVVDDRTVVGHYQ